MEFYIDIGFAVLLRLLRDRRNAAQWEKAFLKLYVMIKHAYPGATHTLDEDFGTTREG